MEKVDYLKVDHVRLRKMPRKIHLKANRNMPRKTHSCTGRAAGSCIISQTHSSSKQKRNSPAALAGRRSAIPVSPVRSYLSQKGIRTPFFLCTVSSITVGQELSGCKVRSVS